MPCAPAAKRSASRVVVEGFQLIEQLDHDDLRDLFNELLVVSDGLQARLGSLTGWDAVQLTGVCTVD